MIREIRLKHGRTIRVDRPGQEPLRLTYLSGDRPKLIVESEEYIDVRSDIAATTRTA